MTPIACRECKGRGRWQESEVDGDEIELVWHYCEVCHGTGIDDDDIKSDYDIGGSSYEDD